MNKPVVVNNLKEVEVKLNAGHRIRESNTHQFNITILTCINWITGAFLLEAEKNNRANEVFNLPETAKHIALELHNKFSKGLITASEVMIECKREGQKMFFILSTKG